MSYDPAWDMPEQNWLPQGSFESPVVPPAFAPDQGTLVCIPPISQSWLPIIQGCLDQLRIPATWKVANDDGMNGVLTWVDQLKRMFSMGGPCCDVAMRLEPGCVLQYSKDGGSTWIDVQDWSTNFATCVSNVIIPPVPPNPGPLPPNQHACNIAGYLSAVVIQHTTQVVINYSQQQAQEVMFANKVMSDLAFVFPITAFAVDALSAYFQIYIAGVISHYTFAGTDPVLWSAVTCAIYNAIKNTGYITSSNLPAVIANICALSYTYTDVINSICGFVTNIGLQNLQAIQSAGAIDDVDCTGCGTWCWQFDFTLGMQGWTILNSGMTPEGTWAAGVGFESTNALGQAVLAIQYTLPQPMTLTHLNLTFTSDCAGTSPGERFYRLRSSGTTVAQYYINGGVQPAPTHSSSGPISVFCDTIILVMECDSTGSIIVSNFQIEGNGPNPFGVGNCTY